MKPWFKERIKMTLRKLSWTWDSYKNVKEKAKVDISTFQCNMCKKYVYTGSSVNNFDSLVIKHGKDKIIMSKVNVDHIDPVESIESGFIDWNTFIERLFCEEKNLQLLCKSCHTIKTNKEVSERTEARKKRKK